MADTCHRRSESRSLWIRLVPVGIICPTGLKIFFNRTVTESGSPGDFFKSSVKRMEHDAPGGKNLLCIKLFVFNLPMQATGKVLKRELSLSPILTGEDGTPDRLFRFPDVAGP